MPPTMKTNFVGMIMGGWWKGELIENISLAHVSSPPVFEVIAYRYITTKSKSRWITIIIIPHL